jgi:hypothetical protein
MNILVVGDSWGFYSPWQNYNTESDTVINLCVMGQSNNNSIVAAHNFLVCNEIKFDVIVWYFTSLLRDHFELNSSFNFKNYLDSINDDTSNRVEMIRKNYPNIKWAIIGGHSPIHNVQKYEWADFIVENWRAELFSEVGEIIPENQSLGKYDKLNYIKSNSPQCIDDIIKELDAEEKIVNLGKKYTPNIFFDEVHPNLDKSTKMCDRVFNYFTQLE